VVRDVLGAALEFVGADGTYQRYDAVAVDPWDLSEVDLHLENRMMVRMGSRSAQHVLWAPPAAGSRQHPHERSGLRRSVRDLSEEVGDGLVAAGWVLNVGLGLDEGGHNPGGREAAEYASWRSRGTVK
jgi:hypothetical protein